MISECRLQRYTTTGGAKKTARYRPNWALKDAPVSLSDFTNVYALITAANAYNQSNYTDLIENVADMENWMRVSAANHAAGNWDCFRLVQHRTERGCVGQRSNTVGRCSLST